ncbi:MAG: hypothetical protein LBG76_04940 [Treponema sp.]|jgi:hypothetical protein|nr:hypothetical protein [Treponema sp.]
MQKRINFEDNIFSLNTRLRMLRDILLLDIDADLFLAKILDDVEFIDHALGAILNSLKENSHLFDREEQFQNLAETEEHFLDVLRTLSQGTGNVSSLKFPPIEERIAQVRNRILERRKLINEIAPESSENVMEPLVSPDELTELLRDLK